MPYDDNLTFNFSMLDDATLQNIFEEQVERYGFHFNDLYFDPDSPLLKCPIDPNRRDVLIKLHQEYYRRRKL